MTCENCKAEVLKLVIHKGALFCWPCHQESKGSINQAPAVISDGIPGGLEVRNAICNTDGTPRKYYSKSEIRKAAYESGWTISGETPNPNPRIVEREQAKQEAKQNAH